MTPAELKPKFKEALAPALLGALAEYVRLVHMSDDPEVYRKFVAWGSDQLNLGEPKRVDNTDSLHVFSFNFSPAGISHSAAQPITFETQTPQARLTAARINADLDFEDAD